jgi:hypothetical protein
MTSGPTAPQGNLVIFIIPAAARRHEGLQTNKPRGKEMASIAK